MNEKLFVDAFERWREDFVYYDELDEEAVVINVGLVAAFHITKAYTPEGRQRIVQAVDIFCRHHGAHLKWGYIGADDLQVHDYSAQNAKVTPAYLAGDGFAEPLAFRWASAEGFATVPDYMIDGYSPAGWMEDIHGSLTTLRFYLPVEEILEGRKARFDELLNEMCRLLEPLHAAAGLGVQHTYQWEDFQHIEFEVANAYQGLDIVRPRGHPGWRAGYSNLNWYSYLNGAWVRKLGTHDELSKALNDTRIGVHALPSGTLIRAGDWPVLWKVGVDERPEHICESQRDYQVPASSGSGGVALWLHCRGGADESVFEQRLAQALRFAVGSRAPRDPASIPLGIASRAGGNCPQQEAVG
ncbi:type VI immunity family protein [Pseudomonas muyukensis]|uniref:DUF3396 domain-containing protein n=1 Tax=Pseudomonas muyukensis TaxID=2842357 RepID=A0ABX8M780_9PSED|nr:type VI immunity family protein [Pseudomonas muyukensis]QXH34829.1 DUF3396 domain-containing protein [Pseudomonas muyukensis]